MLKPSTLAAAAVLAAATLAATLASAAPAAALPERTPAGAPSGGATKLPASAAAPAKGKAAATQDAAVNAYPKCYAAPGCRGLATIATRQQCIHMRDVRWAAGDHGQFSWKMTAPSGCNSPL
jgi:hypothetical protein